MLLFCMMNGPGYFTHADCVVLACGVWWVVLVISHMLTVWCWRVLYDEWSWLFHTCWLCGVGVCCMMNGPGYFTHADCVVLACGVWWVVLVISHMLTVWCWRVLYDEWSWLFHTCWLCGVGVCCMMNGPGYFTHADCVVLACGVWWVVLVISHMLTVWCWRVLYDEWSWLFHTCWLCGVGVCCMMNGPGYFTHADCVVLACVVWWVVLVISHMLTVWCWRVLYDEWSWLFHTCRLCGVGVCCMMSGPGYFTHADCVVLACVVWWMVLVISHMLTVWCWRVLYDEWSWLFHTCWLCGVGVCCMMSGPGYFTHADCVVLACVVWWVVLVISHMLTVWCWRVLYDEWSWLFHTCWLFSVGVWCMMNGPGYFTHADCLVLACGVWWMVLVISHMLTVWCWRVLFDEWSWLFHTCWLCGVGVWCMMNGPGYFTHADCVVLACGVWWVVLVISHMLTV